MPARSVTPPSTTPAPLRGVPIRREKDDTKLTNHSVDDPDIRKAIGSEHLAVDRALLNRMTGDPVNPTSLSCFPSFPDIAAGDNVTRRTVIRKGQRIARSDLCRVPGCTQGESEQSSHLYTVRVPSIDRVAVQCGEIAHVPRGQMDRKKGVHLTPQPLPQRNHRFNCRN